MKHIHSTMFFLILFYNPLCKSFPVLNKSARAKGWCCTKKNGAISSGLTHISNGGR